MRKRVWLAYRLAHTLSWMDRTTKRRKRLPSMKRWVNEVARENEQESKMRVFCTFPRNNELRTEFSATERHVATCFAVVIRLIRVKHVRNAMKSLSCVEIKDSVIQDFTMKRHYVFQWKPYQKLFTTPACTLRTRYYNHFMTHSQSVGHAYENVWFRTFFPKLLK